MWKSGTPEVRQKYYLKSVQFQQELLAANLDYKYNPRRPAEIQRRRYIKVDSEASKGVMRQQDEDVVRALFPGTSFMESTDTDLKIYQPRVAARTRMFAAFLGGFRIRCRLSSPAKERNF